jgi:hypothetical protein
MELIMAKNPYEDQDANVGQTLGTARVGDLAADLVDGMRQTGLLGPSLALLGGGPGPAGTRRGSSTWRGHGNLRCSECCASPGVKG